MSNYITGRAVRELAHTEAELTDRVAAFRSTVASWTANSVQVGDTMNAASQLAEIATLSARLAAQQQTVTLLRAAETNRSEK